METELVCLKTSETDLLFPSTNFTYGSILKVTREVFLKMEEAGIVFDKEKRQDGVRVGMIPDGEAVDVSCFLSRGRRIYPVYAINQEDSLIGFWKNGVRFGKEDCDLLAIGRRFKRNSVTVSHPIVLA